MASARRHPPLRPSSTTNRSVRHLGEKRVPSALSQDSTDEEFRIASGRPVPRSYLLKLIKGSKMNGILNLASRGLTEGNVRETMMTMTTNRCLVPNEIFLEEILEEENQQRSKLKTPDFNQNDNETWWTREPLKTLDLSSNMLTTLPVQIEDLNYLVVLNVNLH